MLDFRTRWAAALPAFAARLWHPGCFQAVPFLSQNAGRVQSVLRAGWPQWSPAGILPSEKARDLWKRFSEVRKQISVCGWPNQNHVKSWEHFCVFRYIIQSSTISFNPCVWLYSRIICITGETESLFSAVPGKTDRCSLSGEGWYAGPKKTDGHMGWVEKEKPPKQWCLHCRTNQNALPFPSAWLPGYSSSQIEEIPLQAHYIMFCEIIILQHSDRIRSACQCLNTGQIWFPAALSEEIWKMKGHREGSLWAAWLVTRLLAFFIVLYPMTSAFSVSVCNRKQSDLH